MVLLGLGLKNSRIIGLLNRVGNPGGLFVTRASTMAKAGVS